MYKLDRYTEDLTVSEYLEKYVDVPKFLEFCKACPNYNKVWSCPAYDFDPMDYWKSYKYITVLTYMITYQNEDSNERRNIMYKVKEDMLNELLFAEGRTPGSRALSAGSCTKCGEGNCAKKIGEPCRFPEQMRYSIESIGGDVVKTAKDLFGLELEWGENNEMPSYIILTGALLSK